MFTDGSMDGILIASVVTRIMAEGNKGGEYLKSIAREPGKEEGQCYKVKIVVEPLAEKEYIEKYKDGFSEDILFYENETAEAGKDGKNA